MSKLGFSLHMIADNKRAHREWTHSHSESYVDNQFVQHANVGFSKFPYRNIFEDLVLKVQSTLIT